MQGIGYNKEELRSPKQRWESNAEMSQQQEAATIPSLGEQREFGNQGFQSSGAGPPVGLVCRGWGSSHAGPTEKQKTLGFSVLF